jgi:hypothetical protein
MEATLESRSDMKVIAAALLALVVPASAAAALEVKLSVVPSSPRKGVSSVVQLRPYWTKVRDDGTCCRLDPADVRYPFKVQAVSPTGRVFRIVVRRTKNRFLWAGRFVFNRRGTWVVRAPQWGPGYVRSYGARPRVQILVRPG